MKDSFKFVIAGSEIPHLSLRATEGGEAISVKLGRGYALSITQREIPRYARNDSLLR